MKKLLTFLMLLNLLFEIGWAETTTVTASKITSNSFSWTGSGRETWSGTVNGGVVNQNTYQTGYVQVGTNSNPSTSVTLSTSGIPGTITSVVFDCAARQGKATVSVTVGENVFGAQNQNVPSWSNNLGGNVTFEGSASGAIVITMTNGDGGGGMYIKSVTVTYTTAPPVVIHKITGIGALSSLTSGDMVELYLPDGYNARVTHVEEIGSAVDAYVRDNTGAMRMTGISPNRPMTYNQHLAGWITGKYTVGSDGIPQFEPVEDYTNTAFLVIADRVTENETEPVEIASDAISDHLGDWVTVSNVRVEIDADDTGSHLGDWVTVSNVRVGDVDVTNKFNLDNYSDQLYDGALVDIHGIAASGKLYPVDDKDEYPITHVVDAQENFVSPTKSISNTQVRFKRAMSNSNYYLLTVPFEFDDFEGEVFEYKGVSLGQVGTYNYNGSQVPIMGGVMHFEKRYYHTLQPGTPYLVKPSSALTEMTLGGVTLSNAAAGSVKYSLAQQNTAGINLMADEQPAYVGDYTLVGSYSPQVLPKDESTAILDGNTVSWTSVAASTAIDGTEAYVTLPAGAGVKFDVPGNGIVTAISEMSIDNVAPREAVIYNIMGVRMTRPLSELPPGIYIVNGKKIVKF